MGFLVGEIIAFLAGAALIGLVIGWALFGGKRAAAPAAPVAGPSVSPEVLKRTEARVKEVEGERDGFSRSLVERDDEIARLRHQIAQNEQHRIESAGRVEQFKNQVTVLQEQLKGVGGVSGAREQREGAGPAAWELEQELRERDAELQQLRHRYDALSAAAGPNAPQVAELKAQVAELRAILESGGPLTAGDESEQVARLMDQAAKLSEENLGLKAAYEAAERSLEEQDGAMDQLSQVLLKSQQEAATLKQEFAALRAQMGRNQTSELGITFPPPLPPLTSPAIAPLPATAVVLSERDEDEDEEDEATRTLSAFDPSDEEVAALPPMAPPLHVRAVFEDRGRDEATRALSALDLPDEAPLQRVTVVAAHPLPPTSSGDPGAVPPPLPAFVAEEATVALGAMEDEDTELETTAPAPSPASVGTAPTPGGRDDLRRIKGIGPALEKRLHGLGIVTWAQLAALDDAGLVSLAEEIKVSVEKIRKDDWIQAAKDLQAGS